MHKVSFKKAIGIIGGAGPMASAHLYKKILEICQKKYHSNDYHEFPEIILISYPFNRGNIEKIGTDLTNCFKKLQNLGASIIGLACNSFHGYLSHTFDDRQFVHLINESIEKAKNLNINNVLILSAPKTIDLKLYEKEGVRCFYPAKDDQTAINLIIREIASGSVSIEQANRLQKIISNFQSIDGVILACTELPLVHEAFPITNELIVIDTVEVLAEKLIQLAQK